MFASSTCIREPRARRCGSGPSDSTFDDADNLIGEAYFGIDDEYIVYQDLFARWTTTYDDQGHAVTTFYGADGEVLE